MTPWKPAGYNQVSPYIVTEKAAEVLAFATETLGAKTLQRHEASNGTIQHAELDIGGSIVMLGQANAGWPSAPCHLHAYVPDVDATYDVTLRAGGVSVRPPATVGSDPNRRCGVRDPGGNTWWFATFTAPGATS